MPFQCIKNIELYIFFVLYLVFCVTDIFGHDHDHDHDNRKTSQSRTITRDRDRDHDREIRHGA